MDIDFVVLWVDGNDPEWQKEKAKYQGKSLNDSNSSNRYRDWGLMPYWFRAVEKFAPWVRKIHFVTCGHLPDFLNTASPKLNIVKHSDFISEEYLPTFSSHAIEMNIHRIPGLSEHFVYFNDDTFLLRPLSETAFFKDGLPCTSAVERPIELKGNFGVWQHAAVNDLSVVNSHFYKKEQLKKYRNKYVNKAYGTKENIRTLALEMLFPDYFTGFKNLHAPAAYLKSTFCDVWEKEPALLNSTSSHRFRDRADVNQWVCLWWQIASGMFSPFNTDNIVSAVTENTEKELCDIIKSQSHDMICINDPEDNIDFDALSKKLKDAFGEILPDKSEFEK